MRHASASRSAILVLSVVVLGLSSCNKKVAQAPAPATPVAAAPAPAQQPTVTLEASPTAITRGGSSTLTWSSTNATEVRLSPGVNELAKEGSKLVSPEDSTLYTITATGPGGQATASTRISVSVPPPPPRATALTPEQMFQQMVKDAFFDYDKADIRPDAKQALTADADFLRAHPEIRVKIEGHCDERGGEEYNLALGDRRADSTKDYLVSLGVSADRIQTLSLGKEQPFCTTENENCYQENRRGHFAMAQ
jgi:peptidoglycan-associated lipoprotein